MTAPGGDAWSPVGTHGAWRTISVIIASGTRRVSSPVLRHSFYGPAESAYATLGARWYTGSIFLIDSADSLLRGPFSY